MSPRQFALVSIAFAVLVVSAASADIRFDRIGQWGGTCNAVTIRGDLAYVGIGPRLVVLDISDPQNPTRIGQTEPLGSFPVEILVDGDYAYVAAFYAGLKIVDIRDPASPVVIGAFAPQGTTVQVAVDGDLLCLGDYDYGFRLLDITDRSNPVELYQLPGSGASRGDLQFYEGLLYYSGGNTLRIYDIASPQAPVLVGNLSGAGGWAMSIRGDVVYIARGLGLTTVDVSDPRRPTVIGNAAAPSNGLLIGIEIIANRAFVIDTDTLNEFEISDPRAPHWLRSLALNAAGHGVGVRGDVAWVANWYDGLRAFDAAPGGDFEMIAEYAETGYVNHVEVFGNTALALGYRRDVAWIDISDVAAPMLRAKFGARALSVEFDGRYAYVGRDNGISIYDLASQSGPVPVWSIDFPLRVVDVQIAGNFLFASAWNQNEYAVGRVLMYDISDPRHPRQIGWDNSLAATRLLLRENLLFITTVVDNALWTYDVSGDGDPQFVSYFPVRGACSDAELVNGYLYAQNGYGIDVLDVSNPRDIQAGPYFHEGNPYIIGIANDGERLFVTPGLREISLEDPFRPQWGATYPTLSYTSGIEYADGRLFLCSEDEGLEIIVTRRRGDVNGDDLIGLEDLAGVLSAFGTCEGQRSFSTFADWNQDGCVELFDLAAILGAIE